MKKSIRTRLKQNNPKRDTMAGELLDSDVDATTNTRVPVPSSNPATNLMIADIVIRGVSTLLRQNVEKRVAKASYGDEQRAQEVLDGRTIMTTLALYSVSKVATKSPIGLGAVAAALVGKTLYDRGKTRQKRKRAEQLAIKDSTTKN